MNSAHRIIMEFSQSNKTCAILAMNSAGTISTSSTVDGFYTASFSSDRPVQVNLESPIHSLFPRHVIHHGNQTIPGLSRYPTTRGHTDIALQGSKYDLFSLDLDKGMRSMLEVYQVAGVLRNYYDVARCALVTHFVCDSAPWLAKELGAGY